MRRRWGLDLCACALRPAQGPGFKETGVTTLVAARGLWVPGPRPEVEPEPGRQVRDGAAGPGRGERGSPGSEAGAAGSQAPDLLLRPPAEPQGTPSVT